MPDLRVAIATLKGLPPGAAANVSAIVMAQLALRDARLFDGDPLVDTIGRPHAAVKYSTVVLSGRQGQLRTLAAHAGASELTVAVFLEEARALNNQFESYRSLVGAASDDSVLVAVAVAGEDSTVRDATKALSAL